MPYEQIGDYEIEYSGVHSLDHQGWAAHVAIFGPSTNPMHRNVLFPDQRVALDTIFASEEEAEQRARAEAVAMIEEGRHRG